MAQNRKTDSKKNDQSDQEDSHPYIGQASSKEGLADKVYTPEKHELVSKRIYLLSLQAVINAVIIGFIAKGMVLLIDFITNIAFNGKLTFAPASPNLEYVGYWVLIIPVIGAVLVGLMARYGSPNIRGHGFPETIEKILGNKSRIPPKLAFLKPISAAISIGTGGPFGAEGPIIATGGAFGSVVGQFMKITAHERKIMLVAGSCAGVSAIFGSPVAGILMAIELLLFEYSPRSLVPVALSCATAAVIHILLFGQKPVFAMPDIPEPTSLAFVIYVLMGFILGVAGAYASKTVYAIEDFFSNHLKKIHWMWWPAIGSVVVGIVGLFAPHTMGIGYDNIRHLLSGKVTLYMILALSFLKFISWSIYLGSGTSGSTLAPLFSIGGALGALLGYIVLHIFPGSEINMATCALIGMAATFAGASRAILTAIVFAFETTSQAHGLLPLIGACTAAYLISFFLMKGGTLYTEKVKRMGIPTPSVFEADILQNILVRNVLGKEVNVLSFNNTIGDARKWIKDNVKDEENTAFVVVNKEEALMGIVKRKDIFSALNDDQAPIASILMNKIAYIYPYNDLGEAVDLMDKYSTDILPVVRPGMDHKVIGVLTHKNIFMAYHQRRNEDEISKQTFSFKQRGIRIILRGRQLFRWEREHGDR